MCGLALIIPRLKCTVANSGPKSYKSTVGQRHRTRPQILCRTGPAYPKAAQALRLQPGRHDLLRLYRPLLAADRGRQTYYAAYPAAHLPHPGHDHGVRGAWIGSGSHEKPDEAVLDPRLSFAFPISCDVGDSVPLPLPARPIPDWRRFQRLSCN